MAADSERDLGELRAKVEALREAFIDFRAEDRRNHADERKAIEDLGEKIIGRLDGYGQRIRKLELWRSAVLGAVAALAALWGLVKGILPMLWTLRP